MSALALPVPQIRAARSRSAGQPGVHPGRHLVAVPGVPRMDAPDPASGCESAAAGLPVAPFAAPVASARLRLTVRGQVVLTILAVAVALLLGTLVGLAMRGGVAPAADSQTVTVGSGDNLWSIAAAVATPGQDTRDVVTDIMELNSLSSVTIRAGQELVVPAHG